MSKINASLLQPSTFYVLLMRCTGVAALIYSQNQKPHSDPISGCSVARGQPIRSDDVSLSDSCLAGKPKNISAVYQNNT